MKNPYVHAILLILLCLLLFTSCDGFGSIPEIRQTSDAASGQNAEEKTEEKTTENASQQNSSQDGLSMAERTALSLLSQRITDLETKFSEWLSAEDGAEKPTEKVPEDEPASTPVPSAGPTTDPGPSVMPPELSSDEAEPAPTDAVSAEDKPVGGAEPSYYSYIIEDGGATITGWSGCTKTVVVPDTIGGFPVRRLADSTFAKKDIEKVELPDTLVEVGWFAFYQCAQLEEVAIPATVQKIGYAAFDGCGSDFKLLVVPGSYAEQYAASFALPLEYR